MRIRRRDLIAGSSLLLVATGAGAQTTTSQSTADLPDRTVVGLEEILVTARRQFERIQDVPQTVNAVTPDTLQNLNLLKFEDVATVLPGLQLSSNNTGFGAAASLRGVSFDPAAQTSGTVEFYFNDAPIEPNFVLQTLFDVGQIELLRGPQGTLRGRASPSGSITITSHKPDLLEFGGYLSASGSDENGYNAQSALNIPLIDEKLAIRIAALYDENEGDRVRSVNNATDPRSESKAGRVSLTFIPTDGLEANISYQRLEKDLTSFDQVAGAGSAGQAGGVVLVPTPAPSGALSPRFPYPVNLTLPAGYNGGTIASGDRRSVLDQPDDLRQEFDAITASVDFHFSGQLLAYVFGYRKQEFRALFSADVGNLAPGFEFFTDSLANQFARSHELRLASEERIANLFDYTVGLFYTKLTSAADVSQPAVLLSGVFGDPLAAPTPGVHNTRFEDPTLVDRDSENVEKSAFASLTWHVTNKTDLTLGGRYIISKADEKTQISFGNAFFAVPAAFLGGVCPPGVTITIPGNCDLPAGAVSPQLAPQVLQTIARNEKKKPFIYNATISQRFNEDVLGYVNVGSSFRRGVAQLGINNVTNDPVLSGLTNLGEERSRSYEVGLKTMGLDNRLRANLALYHQTFDGLITRRTDTVTYLGNQGMGPNLFAFPFVQSADAVVDGVDLDTSFQITPQWDLAFAYSYADGHIDDDTIPCNDGNFDGVEDTLPLTAATFIAAGRTIGLCKTDRTVSAAPRWNATLQSEFFVPIAPKLEGYVRGLFNYFPKNKQQKPRFAADSYNLLNLYVGVRAPNESWDVSVFAKNVFDTKETLTLGSQQLAPQVTGLDSFFTAPSGYFTSSVTQGREVGLMVRYLFGSKE